MTVAYRYALVAAVDDEGLETMSREALEANRPPPAAGLAASQPMGVYIVHWQESPVRFGMEHRGRKAGTDPTMHARVVHTTGTEEEAKDWLENDANGQALMRVAKTVQLCSFSVELP